MIHMIVTDLDNTLLRNDRTISEYTVSVLQACRARGIKVAFATARSAQAVSRFLKRFNPDVFIGYGGAVSLAGDTVVSRFDIPSDISSRLIEECLQTAGIAYIHASNESVAHTNQMNPADNEMSHYQCVDFSQVKDTRYLKISLRAANPGIVEDIAARYPTLDLLRYTGEDLYRFANAKAVKWNAVQAVAGYYGIAVDTMAAFGDDINDTEMIKHCGVGIAVVNAIDEVKAAADDICESNDNDGVAKWIAANVLGG